MEHRQSAVGVLVDAAAHIVTEAMATHSRAAIEAADLVYLSKRGLKEWRC